MGKKRAAPRLLLLGVVSLLAAWMVGCGQTGPAGPAGPSGAATCLNCHNDSAADTLGIRSKIAQYEVSLHGMGDTFTETPAPCNGCHTHEGFLARVAANVNVLPTAAISNSSRIGCWTCHAPHTNGDFRLRSEVPITFVAAGGGSFNAGAGNLCAACHQARPANPPIPAAAGDSVKVTSSRWGPHHAPMANMLAGASGFGSPSYPLTSSRHTELLSSSLKDACVVCHMAPLPRADIAGGHSWKMTYGAVGAESENLTGCYTAGCHTSTTMTSFDYKGVQTEITGLLAQVKARLVAAGIITDATDLVVANKFYKANQLKAVWNYKMVEEEKSLGVHNTAYAKALLNSALEFVPAPPKPSQVAQK